MKYGTLIRVFGDWMWIVSPFTISYGIITFYTEDAKSVANSVKISSSLLELL